MFSLHLTDNSAITDQNPIYVELDSTSATPDPSHWIKCFLRLPDGYNCNFDAGGLSGGAVVRFEGTYAGYWRITEADPSIVAGQPDKSEIRIEVTGGPVGTPLWIRANTIFGEVPVDDRSTQIKVDGEAKKV